MTISTTYGALKTIALNEFGDVVVNLSRSPTLSPLTAPSPTPAVPRRTLAATDSKQISGYAASLHPFIRCPSVASSLAQRYRPKIALCVSPNLPHVYHSLSPWPSPLFGYVYKPSFLIIGCGAKYGTFLINHFVYWAVDLIG